MSRPVINIMAGTKRSWKTGWKSERKPSGKEGRSI